LSPLPTVENLMLMPHQCISHFGDRATRSARAAVDYRWIGTALERE
jgi:hypothetical protein